MSPQRTFLKKTLLAVLVFVLAVSVTLPLWKPAAKRFKWFVVATNVYQDVLRRVHVSSTQIGQPALVRPLSELPSYVRHINSTFDRYRQAGRIADADLRDRRVLEIGPGETLGVALRFIGAGVRHVTAVDKFVPIQTSAFHRELYRTLAGGLEGEEQRRIARAVNLASGVDLNPEFMTYVYGKGVEVAAEDFQPESFDVIVSNAVLEELYDLDRAFAMFDRVLRPGGRQIHVIDMGDYGMFSKYGFHPLEFLTVPDGIYRYMVEATGQPNRRLIDYYRRVTNALRYTTTIYVTRVLGGNTDLPEYRTALQYGRDYSDENLAIIHSIRHRLLPRYRQLSDDDLLIQGIILVAQKPQAAIDAHLR